MKQYFFRKRGSLLNYLNDKNTNYPKLLKTFSTAN